MNNRIEEVRKTEGLTQEEFAKRLKMSRNFICMVENGKREVSDRTISDICREFGVREEWLRTGEGPMKEEKPRDIALAEELEKVLTAGPDDFRREMISILVQMPPEWWCELEEKARELLEESRPDAVPKPRMTREQKADQVGALVREEVLNGGEKASESGTPPTGTGTA